MVWSLDAARLQRAREELEATGKTIDEDTRTLLKNLSLYGCRQLMSRESCLTLRRKIKSLIVAARHKMKMKPVDCC